MLIVMTLSKDPSVCADLASMVMDSYAHPYKVNANFPNPFCLMIYLSTYLSILFNGPPKPEACSELPTNTMGQGEELEPLDPLLFSPSFLFLILTPIVV